MCNNGQSDAVQRSKLEKYHNEKVNEKTGTYGYLIYIRFNNAVLNIGCLRFCNA